MNTEKAEVTKATAITDTRQCKQCEAPVPGGHQGERPDACPQCDMVEAPPLGAGLGLMSEKGQNQNQSPLSSSSLSSFMSSLPDYSESPETSIQEEKCSSDSDIPSTPMQKEKEVTESSSPKKRANRGGRRPACEDCRRRRVRCVHRGLAEGDQTQGYGKRKTDDDGNGSSKKKLVRIVTYNDDPDYKPRRRKSSRKPKPKPKPSPTGTSNPNAGGYMLPTYSNYRQKMDAHLAAFAADMDVVFAGLQDTVASLQATMDKAQRAYETLNEYRDTLERWTEGCT
ncbi:hypothetical protein PHISP_07326 [Aspergillus sp. HF37]|nr:hypothetical protein PHISP_07326 [Aspergillus sp. HF37]